MQVEQIIYGGWSNNIRISNGMVELIITAEVGPRVLRFGFVGGTNMFCENPGDLGKTGGEDWRMYGGHRLWAAPESIPRTIAPDNSAVEIRQEGGEVVFRSALEPSTGLQKEIRLILDEGGRVTITHRITNHNLWAVPFAPWALSVMDAGGKAIIPLPPRATHAENYLPTVPLVLWAYTDLGDPRWTWGQKYFMLQQVPGAETPQKVGVAVPARWAAYANHNQLFVKTFDYDPKATYADFGCNIETFTNEHMLELESLGVYGPVEPGDWVEHIEQWQLFADVPMPQNDADIDRDILPRALEVLG